MMDRPIHVVETWLDAQLARLEALDERRENCAADNTRARVVGHKLAVSLRCARCQAPFRTDEGRRRHLRADSRCTVRDDMRRDPVERTGLVQKSEKENRDVLRVLLRAKEGEEVVRSHCELSGTLTGDGQGTGRS